MGYLLKEALKNLCGANQWSYAVFWKIGCQNPKLLIWEECFFAPVSQSRLLGISRTEDPGIGFEGYNACGFSAGVQAGDNLHLLINKMTTDNHVNVVGEGLVGRAAFTGNHQWILSEDYTREAHPPEVLRELCQQFSAGLQTVAVIPVLPHGVVQFGSFYAMAENMRFVIDVKTLVLRLGNEPVPLVSDNYAAKELSPKIGVPVFLGNSTSGDLSGVSNMITSTPFIADSCNYVENSAQTTDFVGETSRSLERQIQDNVQSNGATFHASSSSQSHVKLYDDLNEAKFSMRMKSNTTLTNELVTKAEVISLNPEVLMNQQASLHIPRSTLHHLSSSSSSTIDSGSSSWVEKGILSHAGILGHFGGLNVSSGVSMSVPRKKSDLISSSLEDPVDHLTTNHLLVYKSGSGHYFTDDRNTKRELNVCNERMENDIIQAHGIPLSKHDEHKISGELLPGFVLADRKLEFEGQSPSFKNTEYEDACIGPQSGDDLFDILGNDFKNKLFNSCWSNRLNNASDSNAGNLDNNNSPSVKSQDTASEIYSLNHGNSNSGIFSVNDSDHLLDAMVSEVHSSAKQRSDDIVSCRTTLTNMSSYYGPNVELPYGQVQVLDQIKGELFGVPEYLAKAEAMSSSFLSGSSKDYSGTYSQSSSIYGSQISSSIVKGHDIKQNSSASAGYSKKPDEMSKTNRKRLKPGENPRPRPKDRQMIQDRVKELREIVPNGAKCSIDALFERTIKHMLFLQSVTKHADKLKQTGESKIISKDDGLLSKDNFEGGATWAYEVGSQTMVCPIIVEDLNQPRQMLVEMLCEERCLFLEIADIIRGLGLTILKGVMETRNDKIWAHFAVEANRDVTRMEIFVSLVHLLEQNAESGIQPAIGISKDIP
ncbi:Transcription factor LHW [Forsythia ovata]|uniref:Transcription factor LHW n=1 Tax=Forsythia ovata TaxID=205694 RepID=A0ABD1RYS3_9LAMI